MCCLFSGAKCKPTERTNIHMVTAVLNTADLFSPDVVNGDSLAIAFSHVALEAKIALHESSIHNSIGHSIRRSNGWSVFLGLNFNPQTISSPLSQTFRQLTFFVVGFDKMSEQCRSNFTSKTGSLKNLYLLLSLPLMKCLVQHTFIILDLFSVCPLLGQTQGQRQVKEHKSTQLTQDSSLCFVLQNGIVSRMCAMKTVEGIREKRKCILCLWQSRGTRTYYIS